MRYLGLIWSNLKRRTLRTLLTLLSIVVAFLLFGFLSVLRNAFAAGVNIARADRIVVSHRTSIIQPLPYAYKQRIEKVPGVTGLAAQVWFNGIYQKPPMQFASIVVEPEDFLSLYPENLITPEVKARWLATRNGAIVGRTTMDRLKWKVGDHIPLTSPIYGQPANQTQWDFEVVGAYDGATKSADTTTFFFRYDYLDEGRTKLKGQVGWYGVRIDNPDRATEIAKKIDAEFANSPSETKTQPEAALMASFAQQFGDMGTITMAVLSAVFFTILLVAGNTMGQAVRERTEEIGVMKSIGFTNERVLVLVLAESCLVAVVGGALGLGLTWLFTAGGNPVPTMLPVWFVPGRDYLFGGALALFVGLVAGLFPAVQAMRLRIAEALRRQA